MPALLGDGVAQGSLPSLAALPRPYTRSGRQTAEQEKPQGQKAGRRYIAHRVWLPLDSKALEHPNIARKGLSHDCHMTSIGRWNGIPSRSPHKLFSFASRVDLEKNRAAGPRGSDIPALPVRCPAYGGWSSKNPKPGKVRERRNTEVQFAPGGATCQRSDLDLESSLVRRSL